MQVGKPAKATPTWTLAGQPGSVKAILEAKVNPPEAGTVTLEGDVTFLAATAGVTVSFKGDNGGKDGLTVTSEPFDVAPALTADGGTVAVVEMAAAMQ